MAVKAEDMKKKGEEQKRERFEKNVTSLETSLETAISREIERGTPARSYTISLDTSGAIDASVLDAVMEHYRQAGWNVEYKLKGGRVYNGWEGTRDYSHLLVLGIRNGTSHENETGSVIHASTIEEKVIAREAEEFEREVTKYEEAIDKILSRDCEYQEIWYEAGALETKLKDRIKALYEQAGWQVIYRIKEVPWQSGRIDQIPCIVFKRQE